MHKLIAIMGLASLLWSGIAFAQDNAAYGNNAYAAPSTDTTGAIQKDFPSRLGFYVYGGIGPAFDLLDESYGYSATISATFHFWYLGLGIDIAWNMLWAGDTKRTDHNDMQYFVTNSAGLFMGHGYIPVGDHFVITLGAGVGLGHQYATVFSDQDVKEHDISWLARVQLGGFYRFENQMLVGLDVVFNFGDYFDIFFQYWDDNKQDRSIGLVFTVGYDFVM